MKPLAYSIIALLGNCALLPAAIIITNPSFELPDLAAGGAQASNGSNLTGWTSSTGPDATYLVDNGANVYFNQAPPDGSQALSLSKGFITQQLNYDGLPSTPVLTSATPQEFTISFFAGSRKQNTLSDGTFSLLLQEYDGSTFLGNLAQQKFVLGSDSDSTTINLNLGVGNWSPELFVTFALSADATPGKNIRVVFAANTPFGSGGGASEAAIDNVSVVPEPSVALLSGVGLLGLFRRRRG